MRKLCIIITVLLVVVVYGNSISYAYEPEFIDSENLTLEILGNREGHLLVERVIGIVLNEYRDGKVLNAFDPEFDYISYRDLDGNEPEPGDIVITYLVYNPESNYDDDIIQRSDWVIGNIYLYDSREIHYLEY